MKKNKIRILVVSHRRSGTHLTIDSLVNNFPILREAKIITLEQIKPDHVTHIPLVEVKKIIDNAPVVIIKTHFLPDISMYNLSEEENLFVKDVFRDYQILYACRNGLDVMVSLYKYMSQYDEAVRNITFNSFVNQNNNFDPKPELPRLDFWAYHLQAWLNGSYHERIIKLRFEDWTSNYNQTILNISKFLEIPNNKKVRDITLQNNKSFFKRAFRKLLRISGKKDDVVITSILPSKGKTDQWKKYFDDKTLQSIHVSVKQEMQQQGYDF